ncbi:MAG: PEP/pyruvate-binding domain-containing protein [Caulobacter sp.]|nr:PEP/pyruvate-binding domain-containing protein [Caulobacter sp.]
MTRRLAGLLAVVLALLAARPALADERSAPAIADRAQYEALARTPAAGRYFNTPQLMFVIDRADRKESPTGRLYFVNSKRFDFHITFVQQTYLSNRPAEALIAANYSQPNRRFIFGSVVFYPGLARYGVEFFEGDALDTTVLGEAMTALKAHFFAPLAFKPNSRQQYDLAARVGGIDIIDGAAAYGSREVLVLNPGKAVGRLRIIGEITPETDLRPDDIVMLDVPPVQLEPVAGVITTAFSTPLSHVNLLAKSWGVPNAYRRDAGTAYAALDGQVVVLEAKADAVTLRPATTAEAKAAARKAKGAVKVPEADLSYAGLPSLAEQRRTDSVRVGAKSANLGEVTYRRARAKGADFTVPPGFAIPFSAYDRFVRSNGLDKAIDALLADPNLKTDRAARHAALARLRAAFAAGTIDPLLMEAVNARRRAVIGAGGVFARSSTNAEDLPGFNGAGLYTSVPNVVTDAQLAAAIRTVWGSVWNDAAFEAREAARIDHRAVHAAVLVQQGMNAEASGVMITENPFDPDEPDAVFINAKRGLGMRVVEGKRVAEQLIYHGETDGSLQVLTRSTDDTMLSFDDKGGVKEIRIEEGRFVLTDALALRLAKAGLTIDGWLGGAAQDIEWLTIGDRLYIVQARPYLRGH